MDFNAGIYHEPGGILKKISLQNSRFLNNPYVNVHFHAHCAFFRLLELWPACSRARANDAWAFKKSRFHENSGFRKSARMGSSGTCFLNINSIKYHAKNTLTRLAFFP
jgi:hypothetical protein